MNMTQPLPLLGVLHATHSAKATPARAAPPALPGLVQELPDTVPASEEELAKSCPTASPQSLESDDKRSAPSSPTSSLPPSASRAGENAVL